MLESYSLNQKDFYNFITSVKNNNKISHAYLIETNGVSYGFDLALAMAKYFFDDNDSCFDLVVIDNVKDEIKKEQVLGLQRDFSTKSLNGSYRIYIIKDASLLNKSSANSILKFLEEPEDDIIAILLCNNVNNVLETIVSRCQVISLSYESDDIKSLFIPYCEDLLNIDYYCDDMTKKIVSFFDFLEHNGSLMIAFKDDYIDCKDISLYLKVGVYLYFDVLKLMLSCDSVFFSDFDDIKKYIMKNNSLDDIINKIDILNQFILNVNYNVNKDLFVDNFLITFSGGVNK